jgi:hypothetical protein
MVVYPLYLAWKKCYYLIQESESGRYNHYIWFGGNVTIEFKKANREYINITSGVEEMSLPNSSKRIKPV